MYGVIELECVFRGCLKVGLDYVSTYFQAVARHFARRERMA